MPSIESKVMLYRQRYPTLHMGIMGTVNQSRPPLCPCGGRQALIIWHGTTPEQICLTCEGEPSQLTLNFAPD